ncbi:hypothetical protein GFK26_32475 [Variovorax paradoxus]|uniref:Uncharacterized protein n=1 Tax=Variovorax paradoxus TaxID=34073 RepID=A0A5Q0MBE5_VARPD|nr:HEPN domain-containing protein [Variovorax paradoxus]QFZ87160.1 hypothetical protein GFK26_32475 [Variovorax paradoxus]
MTSGSPQKINFDQLTENSLKWLDWIEGATKLQGLIKGNVNFDGLEGDEKKFVASRLNEVAPNRQLLLNSVYITMTAGFEEYLRTTLKAMADNLNQEAKPPNAHHKTLVNFNIRETAKLLRRMDSPPDYITFNHDDLCRILGSCATGSQAVQFNGEALSDVDGLIRLKNFCERAEGLGKRVDLDVAAKDPAIKIALKQEKNNSARDVRKLLEDELEIISRYRNRIAHIGGNASDVTEPVLRSHKYLLSAVAVAIENQIQNRAKK